ncbi:MAG: hypothetical protein PUP93_12115 [Rhizonema sp. NSF051]|nr:hypothetical protein [Rhizonema sp. NSF051]
MIKLRFGKEMVRSLLNDGERYTDSKTLPIADSLGNRMRSREELAAFRKARSLSGGFLCTAEQRRFPCVFAPANPKKAKELWGIGNKNFFNSPCSVSISSASSYLPN